MHLELQPAPVLILYGPDTTSQDATARVIAAKTGRPLMSINLQAIVAQEEPPIQSLRLCMRDSRLTNAIPYISGWDASITDGTVAPDDTRGNSVNTLVMIIVGGKQSWQARGIDRQRQLFWIQYDGPDYAQRLSPVVPLHRC